MKIIKKEPTNLFDSTKPNNIKILDKNPTKGGIPAIEKNIIINDKDHNLFILKKLAKLDKNTGVCALLLNKLIFSCKKKKIAK